MADQNTTYEFRVTKLTQLAYDIEKNLNEKKQELRTVKRDFREKIKKWKIDKQMLSAKDQQLEEVNEIKLRLEEKIRDIYETK